MNVTGVFKNVFIILRCPYQNTCQHPYDNLWFTECYWIFLGRLHDFNKKKKKKEISVKRKKNTHEDPNKNLNIVAKGDQTLKNISLQPISHPV